MKERGLRRGVRSGSGKPTNGRKIQEITALPMCNGQRSAVKSLQEIIISMPSYIEFAQV
jgi:hypothetical protein